MKTNIIILSACILSLTILTIIAFTNGLFFTFIFSCFGLWWGVTQLFKELS